jgi:hypothetical protein
MNYEGELRERWKCGAWFERIGGMKVDGTRPLSGILFIHPTIPDRIKKRFSGQ